MAVETACPTERPVSRAGLKSRAGYSPPPFHYSGFGGVNTLSAIP